MKTRKKKGKRMQGKEKKENKKEWRKLRQKRQDRISKRKKKGKKENEKKRKKYHYQWFRFIGFALYLNSHKRYSIETISIVLFMLRRRIIRNPSDLQGCLVSVPVFMKEHFY